MIVSLGQTTISRQSLITGFVAKAIQSAQTAGAEPPYTVKPEYYSALVTEGTAFLNSVGVKYGYTYTEAEIDAALRAAGYIPSADYQVGSRADNVHLAINYALSNVRVVVTPTGDPWRVNQALFARMIDLAMDKLRELDPSFAVTVSRAQMGAYIVQRGYIASAPPPIVQPTATVIVTPIVTPLPYTSPPVKTIAIQPVPYTPPEPIYHIPEITPPIQQRWEPLPEPPPAWDIPPVVTYLETPTVTAEQGDKKDLILWAILAAVGGLALGTMGQRR